MLSCRSRDFPTFGDIIILFIFIFHLHPQIKSVYIVKGFFPAHNSQKMEIWFFSGS